MIGEADMSFYELNLTLPGLWRQEQAGQHMGPQEQKAQEDIQGIYILHMKSQGLWLVKTAGRNFATDCWAV